VTGQKLGVYWSADVFKIVAKIPPSINSLTKFSLERLEDNADMHGTVELGLFNASELLLISNVQHNAVGGIEDSDSITKDSDAPTTRSMTKPAKTKRSRFVGVMIDILNRKVPFR